MSEINIVGLLASTAQEYPGKNAIVWQEAEIPFDLLNNKVSQVARRLNRIGIATGDRVGVCLANHPNFIFACLGVMRAGGTPVPLNFRLRPPELLDLIDTIDMASVLVEPRMSSISEKLVVADDAWWRGVWDIDPGEDPFPTPGLLAAILLTSGTTGKPMGIGRSHEEMWARTVHNQDVRPGGSKEIYLSALPLSFSAGFAVAIGALLNGATVVMLPSIYSAEQFVDTIERYGVTSTMVVPALLRTLLSLAPDDGLLFPDLGFLSCGGAPLSPDEKLAAYRRLSPGFSENYASSLGGVVSVLKGQDVIDHPDSVGRIRANVTLQIVDDRNEPLPQGQIGIIRYRSEGVAPTLIGERSHSVGDKIIDGWVYPGELGRLGDGGLLYLEGRASEMMVVGGANVFPQEIVNVLIRHPQVYDAAVLSRPSDALGEEPVAFAVAKNGITPEELASHCVANLTAYKVPKQIFLVDALPYNANGKIDRAILRALLTPRGDAN